MSTDPLAWTLPLVSGAAFVAWVCFARRLFGDMAPDLYVGPRIITVATLTLIALAVFLASLQYPGLIPSDEARFVLSIGRIVLLVGGISALVALRRVQR